MKIILGIVVLLAQLSCARFDNKSQIKGDCVLLEVAKTRASCGIMSVWVGMKFQEKNSNVTFIGLVHCPEMYRNERPGENFFVAGAMYQIEAKKTYKLPKGDIELNEYSGLGYITYKIDDLKFKKAN